MRLVMLVNNRSDGDVKELIASQALYASLFFKREFELLKEGRAKPKKPLSTKVGCEKFDAGMCLRDGPDAVRLDGSDFVRVRQERGCRGVMLESGTVVPAPGEQLEVKIERRCPHRSNVNTWITRT